MPKSNIKFILCDQMRDLLKFTSPFPEEKTANKHEDISMTFTIWLSRLALHYCCTLLNSSENREAKEWS